MLKLNKVKDLSNKGLKVSDVYNKYKSTHGVLVVFKIQKVFTELLITKFNIDKFSDFKVYDVYLNYDFDYNYHYPIEKVFVYLCK